MVKPPVGWGVREICDANGWSYNDYILDILAVTMNRPQDSPWNGAIAAAVKAGTYRTADDLAEQELPISRIA